MSPHETGSAGNDCMKIKLEKHDYFRVKSGFLQHIVPFLLCTRRFQAGSVTALQA